MASPVPTTYVRGVAPAVVRAPHVLHWQAYSLSRLVNLCLAIYYCSIFWRHADDQAWVEMMAWFRVSAMAGIAAYGVVLFSLPTWLIPDALGMLATGLSLLNSASGLLNMVRFVVGTAVVPSLCWCVMNDCAQAAIARRKDASEIPLAFNVMNLFTSYVPRVFLCALRNSPRLPCDGRRCVWMSYALVISDSYLIVQNVVAVGLATLSLLLKYNWPGGSPAVEGTEAKPLSESGSVVDAEAGGADNGNGVDIESQQLLPPSS